MLGLETRRKHYREPMSVLLFRQLPNTFAPDIMTVGWQDNKNASDFVFHMRDQVRSWADFLCSLVHLVPIHQNMPDDCTADPPPSAAGLPLPATPAEEEAEQREMRSHLLQRPRTYLLL